MRVVSLIVFLAITATVVSQSDSSAVEKADHLDFNGYIKNMQIFGFKDLDDISSDNLIHNRLNFRLYPWSDLSVALELRNRIFTGESVDAFPDYADLVDVDDGLVDLSWVLVDKPSLVMLSQVDRAWIEWSNDQWEIRAGRQRINWGTNLFWNTNDLFNVYSIIDFDYEERPGSDAIRVQHHLKDMSTLDFAVSPGNEKDEHIAALMYRFNKRQYDIQVLAAKWYEDYVAGIGWAGNMWQAGLKGEASLFIPESEGESVFTTSVSADYVFKSELFLTGGLLYNSAIRNEVVIQPQIVSDASLSAKRLMPNEFAGIISAQYPFTPILTGGLITIYGTGVTSLFVMPSIGYSISDNWELALFGQSFWMEQPDLRNLANGVFIRVKGSF